MPRTSQLPTRPLSTLSEISRTQMLSTREKLKLLTELRRDAMFTPRARTELGFDTADVDREIEGLRRRVWRGVGPRIERQGEHR